MKEIAYLYLALAIIAEVVAMNALKASMEFTKLWPTVIMIIGYLLALYLMTLVLRTIPVGITYAIWAGVGIVFVTITSAIIYKQIPDLASIIGMTLIITGVVVIHLFSKNIGH